MRHVGRVHDRLRASKARAGQTLEQQVDNAVTRYERAKKQIEDVMGLSFTMTASGTGQWGTPDGGYGAVQGLFTPSIHWKVHEGRIGTGSFQFAYNAPQYWSGATGASLQGRLNLNSAINDFPTSAPSYSQLSYTHALPGNWFALTIGQFPFANFDGNAYANDQQVNFLGYSLAQNGSQNYSTGSLGAYVQVGPVAHVTFAAGFQDANNVAANYILFDTVGRGQYAWFGYLAWSPTVPAFGQGEYSLLYYNLPSVTAQPQAGSGLSFSASQPIGPHWGVFVRANTAWNSSWYIQSSIAGGAVYNDPLGRDPLDQIGLGFAWNRTNQALYGGTFARPSETMIELYWAWTVFRRLQITPDVQLYFQPALTPAQQLAAVFSIRVAALF
ncbi:MAG: carbohydrate porin [Enhydrobacter sp.]|nr:MAG: carbohydrate porin [Enhydrobacter sp.]